MRKTLGYIIVCATTKLAGVLLNYMLVKEKLTVVRKVQSFMLHHKKDLTAKLLVRDTQRSP